MRHHVTGITDNFGVAVSVYFEGVSVSGVGGQPALSLSDVHKASLQRVRIVDNRGGALRASSVTGMLMLQCQVLRNIGVGFSNIAGGATVTAIQDLYMLETAFAHNVGSVAGAVFLQSCGQVVINSCKFVENEAAQNGGALRAVATESIIVELSRLQQPENISCMATDAHAIDFFLVQYDTIDTSGTTQSKVVCQKALLGGIPSVFEHNAAGGSGGAVAIEGLTLAAWDVDDAVFQGNR